MARRGGAGGAEPGGAARGHRRGRARIASASCGATGGSPGPTSPTAPGGSRPCCATPGSASHRPLDECEGWESPHDHVALYLHNGNEYLEGMLGAAKARAVGGQHQLPLRGRGAPLRPPRQRGAGDRVPRRLRADARARCSPRSPSRRCSSRSTTTPALPSSPARSRTRPRSRPPNPGRPRTSAPTTSTSSTPAAPPGMPKGVLWRQADFLAACLGIDQTTEQLVEGARRSSLRALPAAPFMHGAAHWNALSCLDDRRHRRGPARPGRLDPHDVLDTVERERATSLLIVGDAFARPLVDALRARRPRRVEPAAPPHRRRHPVGQREGRPARAGPRPADRRRARLLGDRTPGRADVRPLPRRHHRHLRALPHQRRALRATSAGGSSPGDPELGWLAQTGRVPRGYLGDPDEDRPHLPRRSTACATPWPATAPGCSPDGSLELLGRDSVTINTGGEKVFAEEVEQALKRHPDVFDVVVVGPPERAMGPGGGRGRPAPRRHATPPTTTCVRRPRRARGSLQAAEGGRARAGRRAQPERQARLPLGGGSGPRGPASTSVWRPMSRRTIPLPFAVDLATVAAARCAWASTTPRSCSAPRTALWATRTPDGPCHRARGPPRRPARGRGVGRRAPTHALDQAPAWLGLLDDRAGFDPTDPIVARPPPPRRRPAAAPHRSGWSRPSCRPSSARRSPASRPSGRYRQLVERWGEPAPGPGGLQLLPRSDVIAELGYYDLHVIGVEKRRADTLQSGRRPRARAWRRPASGAPGTLRDRLQAIPGIGPWTVAEVDPARRSVTPTR